MRRTFPLDWAIDPPEAVTIPATIPARGKRSDRSVAKALRFFSKPTLVEYMSRTDLPGLFNVRYELLYLIELRNATQEQVRIQLQWKALHAYLLKRKAIRVDGDAIWFCCAQCAAAGVMVVRTVDAQGEQQ